MEHDVVWHGTATPTPSFGSSSAASRNGERRQVVAQVRLPHVRLHLAAARPLDEGAVDDAEVHDAAYASVEICVRATPREGGPRGRSPRASISAWLWLLQLTPVKPAAVRLLRVRGESGVELWR